MGSAYDLRNRDFSAFSGYRHELIAMPNLSRQMKFWIASVVVAAFALWLLHGILLPFVAGMALAYLQAPLVGRLERLHLPRLAASLLVVGMVVLGFLLLLIVIVPLLGAELTAFVAKLPDYVTRLQALAAEPGQEWLQRILGEGLSDIGKSTGELVQQGLGWLVAFLRSLWSGGRALVSIFSLVVVTPVVAFYLLYDWNRMVAAVDAWIPRPHRDIVRELAGQINDAIAGFLRGQSSVCLILGSYYAIGLTLTGLNFGLLIGVIAGIITFVPYVGSLTGLVVAVGVALAQFWPNYTPILEVLGVVLFGQFVEGNVLSPKLVGESVGLHPVWVIFALFAFGYLFGFVGLLVAVPVAAAFGVLARFALRRYLDSPLYTGITQPSPADLAALPRRIEPS